MLVFKIIVILAIVFCVVNLAFTIHMLVCTNKMIGSVQNWAEEIDRSNLNYIRQEFARLKYENGLVLGDLNNNNEEKEEEK